MDAMLGPHVAEVIERLSELRRKLQAFLKILFRLRVVPFALVSRADLEIKAFIQPLRVGGLRNDFGRSEMLNGLSITLLPAERHPGQKFEHETL